MPHDEMVRSDKPVFVVMDSNVLIAEDLCGSLQASVACRVLSVSQPNELLRVVEQEPVVTAAFLEMRYEQIVQSGLHLILGERGARIVLTNGEDDDSMLQQHGWSMLVRPFTEEMVRLILARYIQIT